MEGDEDSLVEDRMEAGVEEVEAGNVANSFSCER